MKRLLPRFTTHRTMLCATDGEWSGVMLTVVWGSILVEYTFARRSRAIA